MLSPSGFVFAEGKARLAENNSVLWRYIQLWRFRNSRLIGQLVSPAHHLVLEGFPRSGNSFSVKYFFLTNGSRRAWSVAHHFHRFPQVELGVRWSRPTIVLMRSPDDAVLSLLAHSILKGIIAPGDDAFHLSCLKVFYRRWECFYKHKMLREKGIVLSDFSSTIDNFGVVLEAVNDQFGTDFAVSIPSVEEQKRIFETGGPHLSPNADRTAIKRRLRVLIESQLIQAQRSSANRVYDTLLPFALTAE